MTGYSALAPVYDRFTQNVDYEALADRITTAFKENKIEGIVLDAGCGTGTLTFMLAKRGYDMIGADACEDMLAEAALKNTDGAVALLCQPLEKLDLYGTVRGVVCTLDTLNHVPSERALDEIIRRFALFTEPGGLLIFDANTPYKHAQILANNCFVYEDDGCMCVWRNEYQPEKKRVLLTADVFCECPNGSYSRDTDSFFEYDREPALFLRLLKKHGYSLISLLDYDTMQAPTSTTQRIFVIAKKSSD